MSYQFIHIEDYGRVVSKKTKNNGSNDKYKKETKGRSVREIIAEAKREKETVHMLKIQKILFCFLVLVWMKWKNSLMNITTIQK
jgi:predicted metal-binding protein